MSRFDKVVPGVGSFRAKLNAALTSANVGKAYGVSLNATGRVVIGGTTIADICGVIVVNEAMAAGDPIDVMRLGEVVEFTATAGAASTAGTAYYAATNGDISTTNTGKAVGRTVEVGRLVVHVASLA
jgi:hypothetical protein